MITCDGCRRSTGGACPAHGVQTITFPGVAEATAVYHQHVWRYDGPDGPYYVYHCDAHDPPVVRTVWHTDARGAQS